MPIAKAYSVPIVTVASRGSGTKKRILRSASGNNETIAEPAEGGLRLSGRKVFVPDGDAADLLQEVLVIVARKIRSFEFDPVRGRFRTWLLAIVKYKLIDRIRRQSVRPDVVGDAGNNWRLDSLADPSADPDELWEMEYRRQLVLRALPKLQSQFHGKTWEAFRRTAIEDGNPTEVARELGMSLGAVYIAKSRVLAKLREQVERLNHEWEPGLPSSRLRFGR